MRRTDRIRLRSSLKRSMKLGGQIAPNVGDRPEAREAARYRLATLILGLAHNGGQLDVERLRDTAVDLMRANVTKLGPKKVIKSGTDVAVAIVLAASFAAWVLAYAVLLIMYGEHAGH
jgi:hypothetical protein